MALGWAARLAIGLCMLAVVGNGLSQAQAQQGQPRQQGQTNVIQSIEVEGNQRIEAAIIERRGKRHLRALRRHAQMVEQRRQIGVIALVIDDEPGIDRRFRLAGWDHHRVGMAARTAFGLKERDAMFL